MRFLLVWACAVGLCAAESVAWLPLPPLTWHDDHPAPSPAALVGRAMFIQIFDLAPGADGKSPLLEYHKQEWWWTDGGRSTDFRKACLMVSVSGRLPARDPERQPTILKAESALPGLVRAFAGEGTGVVIQVDARGRIVSIARSGADMNAAFAKFDALVPAEGVLVPNPNSFPVACAPALNLFKIADVAGGLSLCARKLGPAGQSLAASVQEQATVLADAEAEAVMAPAAAPESGAADRFIALGRLRALQVQFPSVGQRPKVTKALSLAAKDQALIQEQAGWASLQGYLTAIGKAQPKKVQALQKAQLQAIETNFPKTYASDIVGKIKALLPP